MNQINLKSLVFIGCLLALAISINSCKDPETTPTPGIAEDLFTTVKIEMTDTLTGQKLNFYYRDMDGEGANAPGQWDTIKLSDSSFYKVSVKFLNESNPNSIVDITQKIAAEKTSHIICLLPSVVNTTITRTDTDGTYEIGLSSTWKTGAISNGDITITLKHQSGTKNGTCDPGETDVEVKFPAKVL